MAEADEQAFRPETFYGNVDIQSIRFRVKSAPSVAHVRAAQRLGWGEPLGLTQASLIEYDDFAVDGWRFRHQAVLPLRSGRDILPSNRDPGA